MAIALQASIVAVSQGLPVAMPLLSVFAVESGEGEKRGQMKRRRRSVGGQNHRVTIHSGTAATTGWV